MNRTLAIAGTILALFLPAAVFAHATPVDMQPNTGARLDSAPKEIAIRFSESLESGSSRIRVVSASGAQVQQGDAVVSGDGHTLIVPVLGESGIFTVTWSVVSKDDGHFTRGSFAYSVGSELAPPSVQEEVVQIATTQEAVYMFVEFLGNSILWGLLVLFVFVRDTRVRRIFVMLAASAAVLGLCGAIGQLILKTHQLAGLHEIGLGDAFHLYRHTTAGFSTIIRGIALTTAGVLAALFGFRTVRSTAVFIGTPLLVFAFFRAIVSHASANPFYPTLSIAVNFIHVIEKDLWLGVLLVLCVLMTSRVRETVVPELVPRVLSLLSANLAVLTLTAGYIVWLHLKSFSNVTTTNWGQVFIPLLVSALFLIALHIYHVVIRIMYPRIAQKYFASTIGAQTAAAALVVFFTSVVIITSPPSHTALSTFIAHDGETSVSLSRAPYEDGMALLTIQGTEIGKPTVFIGSRDGGLQPALELRFKGGYVFPSALIPASNTLVGISVPRTDGYDAQATFEVSAADFAIPSGHGRTFDIFTLMLISVSLAGVLLSVGLVSAGKARTHNVELRLAGGRMFVGGFAALLIILMCVVGAGRILQNQFEARCISDGNMWHLMQPTAAGRVISGEAREGCMWGMGAQSYLFADERQYEYLSTLGEAAVSLDLKPTVLRTGVPTDLTFSLKNSDGTPATLLVDMEKYMHVVIISSDESEFAHIHPDDLAPLTQDAINTSTFTVRYTFPKAGTYLVSVDYAHGTNLESKQFPVTVTGSPSQQSEPLTFASPGTFHGYEVSMEHAGAYSGEVTTLKFNVSRDGVPVKNMQPYLSAVSHVSVIKNDLSAFIHTHGEVHAPGVAVPPVNVVNGKIVHSMSSMTAPAAFGPTFDAHVLFPSRGRYTVWAQIKIDGVVIPTSFTVDVDE